MAWSSDGRLRLEDGSYVSPELVLVDPELAAWARRHVPNPLEEAALARISELESEVVVAETTPEDPAGPWSATNHRRWMKVLAAAALLATALLIADVRVEFGKGRASAETTVVDEESELPASTAKRESDVATKHPSAGRPKIAPATGRQTSGRTGATGRPTRPVQRTTQPQRFAWAPTVGARGYHVELFRAATKVFAADTTSPTITVPMSWTHGGRTQRLEPGEYRWYVWPVTTEGRAVRAIVQATLTIPAR